MLSTAICGIVNDHFPLFFLIHYNIFPASIFANRGISVLMPDRSRDLVVTSSDKITVLVNRDKTTINIFKRI